MAYYLSFHLELKATEFRNLLQQRYALDYGNEVNSDCFLPRYLYFFGIKNRNLNDSSLNPNAPF